MVGCVGGDGRSYWGLHCVSVKERALPSWLACLHSVKHVHMSLLCCLFTSAVAKFLFSYLAGRQHGFREPNNVSYGHVYSLYHISLLHRPS